MQWIPHSPLVQHLTTSWEPAWLRIYFNPLAFSSIGGTVCAAELIQLSLGVNPLEWAKAYDFGRQVGSDPGGGGGIRQIAAFLMSYTDYFSGFFIFFSVKNIENAKKAFLEEFTEV